MSRDYRARLTARLLLHHAKKAKALRDRQEPPPRSRTAEINRGTS